MCFYNSDIKVELSVSLFLHNSLQEGTGSSFTEREF